MKWSFLVVLYCVYRNGWNEIVRNRNNYVQAGRSCWLWTSSRKFDGRYRRPNQLGSAQQPSGWRHQVRPDRSAQRRGSRRRFSSESILQRCGSRIIVRVSVAILRHHRLDERHGHFGSVLQKQFQEKRKHINSVASFKDFFVVIIALNWRIYHDWTRLEIRTKMFNPK